MCTILWCFLSMKSKKASKCYVKTRVMPGVVSFLTGVVNLSSSAWLSLWHFNWNIDSNLNTLFSILPLVNMSLLSYIRFCIVCIVEFFVQQKTSHVFLTHAYSLLQPFALELLNNTKLMAMSICKQEGSVPAHAKHRTGWEITNKYMWGKRNRLMICYPVHEGNHCESKADFENKSWDKSIHTHK